MHVPPFPFDVITTGDHAKTGVDLLCHFISGETQNRGMRKEASKSIILSLACYNIKTGVNLDSQSENVKLHLYSSASVNYLSLFLATTLVFCFFA